MKAAVFHEVGRPLTIETLPEPTPGPAELVLRVKHAGICGSDLHMADRPGGLPVGAVMGHEFAGEVVAVGKEARAQWKEGARVCAQPFIGCGTCRECLNGNGVRCASFQDIGIGNIPGGYAEYVRVGMHETLALPENVDYSLGAAVEPLAVGLHAVNKAGLRGGENVLVIGAGPIGLVTAMWAKFFGARAIVVSERAAGRLALADKFGATGGIDASKENVRQAYRKQAGAPPDIIFECVGVPGVLQDCINIASPDCRIVVVGVCMQEDRILPLKAIAKDLQFRFVYYYRKQDFRFTLDMLAAERVNPRDMLTGQVGFDTFAECFEALKQPSTQCKVQLTP